MLAARVSLLNRPLAESYWISKLRTIVLRQILLRTIVLSKPASPLAILDVLGDRDRRVPLGGALNGT